MKSDDGKNKTYNAKDRIIVFVGFPGSSMLDGAKLYEVVFEREGNMVLYSVNYNEYLLKMGNKDKAKQFSSQGMLGNKKPDKIQKEFDEYVNCSALIYSDYKTDTAEGLIQLVNDYAEKCKS